MASRDITPAVVAEINGRTVSPILLFQAQFDSGNLELWTGHGLITWNGIEFVGAGELGSVSAVKETQKLRADEILFTLSGVPATMISLAYNEEYQGRPVKLWLAFLDANFAVIADPYQIFDGLMDVMRDVDAGEMAAITVSAEHELVRLFRPNLRHYTPEDQHLDDAADTFFDFNAALINREITLRG